MDINSWRTAVPAASKAHNIIDSDSDSDGDLPDLQARFAQLHNDSKTETNSNSSRNVSSASTSNPLPFLPAHQAPRLVAPKASNASSLFITQQKKPAASTSKPTQYRQPREIIEIDDSPPPKPKIASAASHKYLSTATTSVESRKPLTEITSSSSDNSIAQQQQQKPSSSKPSTSSSNVSGYETYKYRLEDRKPTLTPKKPSHYDTCNPVMSTKARILAQFNQSQGIPGASTPIGKGRDPTTYPSHHGYSAPVDPDLSGDLDAALIEKINKRVDEKESTFKEAYAEDPEEALQAFCKDIHTDMSEVERSEAQPEGLKCELKRHQIDGVAWLKSREKGKKRGGILADDMGLGKTVQSIALMLANRPTDKPRGTLIVAPVGLLEQWKQEIKTKTNCEPKFRILLHHGPDRTTDPRKIAKYDVVLTNYESLRNDLPGDAKKSTKKNAKTKSFLMPDSDDEAKSAIDMKEAGPLLQVEFHRVILDEAHTIKNYTTAAARSCFLIKAKYRWCLTGTPIQNSISDLYSLFHFLGTAVKPLNDHAEFKRRIEMPLKGNKTNLAMKRLHYVLASVMLRRTKYTMTDGKPLIVLPPRTIEVIKTDFLDPEEKAYYEAVQQKIQLQVNKFLKAGSLNSEYMAVLVLLLRLRQICNHPDLMNKGNDKQDRELVTIKDSKKDITGKLDDDVDVDDLAAAFGSIGLRSQPCLVCQEPFKPSQAGDKQCRECMMILNHSRRDGSPDDTGPEASTKVIKLIELLKQMKKEDPDRKALVFSQFTSMFDILQPFLKRAGIKYVVYDGKMNRKQREESLTSIRENPKVTVILVSLKCGALGLNLTCCSTVFILDLWWNPAIENQAIDRAHRMGQEKEVKVFKFVINETVEERILTLQEEKKAVADAALDGGNVKKLNKLSAKDLLYLFKGDGGSDFDLPAPGPAIGKPLPGAFKFS